MKNVKSNVRKLKFIISAFFFFNAGKKEVGKKKSTDKFLLK